MTSHEITPAPSLTYLVREPSFVSPAECQRVIDLARREGERDIARTYRRNGDKRVEIPLPTLAKASASDAPMLMGLRAKVTDCCQHLWNSVQGETSTNSTLAVNFSLVSCSRAGDMHPRHADNARRDPSTLAWSPNHTPFRVLTALTYLNTCDRDFEGGELYFPRLNMAIKPEAGLLIASPSDENWEHQMLPVTFGERYVLAIWFTTDPGKVEYTG